MTKTIIFDLDGTLTESKSALTPDMGALLARLLEKMPVAIMSGGSYAQFERQFLGNMPVGTHLTNLYLFPTSAAQCYVWKDGAWEHLYNNPLTPEEKSRVLAALAAALHETGLDVPPPQLWGEQTEDRGSQITWSSLGQQAPIEEKKAWDPDQKKRRPLQAALLRRLPDFSVRVNATNSVDITRAGLDKAYGVRKFSEIIATPIADMLYVGDGLFVGGNDEIVKETGIPTEAVTGPADTAKIIERLLPNA
ncbi:MAG: HAD-IIB family hydrolase [Candidatus Paceibacterota bacterium]|jgi:hypothetical protein